MILRIKYQIFGENNMKHLETYESYEGDMNIQKNAVVVDYIDFDYLHPSVEMDEKEPPNTTGRDDMQNKNKTKKSTIRISAT